MSGYLADLLVTTSPAGELENDCVLPMLTSNFLSYSVSFRNVGILLSVVVLVSLILGFRVAFDELVKHRTLLVVATLGWMGTLVFTMSAILALHVLPRLKCVVL